MCNGSRVIDEIGEGVVGMDSIPRDAARGLCGTMTRVAENQRLLPAAAVLPQVRLPAALAAITISSSVPTLRRPFSAGSIPAGVTLLRALL